MSRSIVRSLLITTTGLTMAGAAIPASAQDKPTNSSAADAQADADGKQIGTVRVTAAGEDAGDPGAVPRGANGSSDPTATEATRSYAPTKVNIGGKVPVEVKDVPQTVSVITRQLIEDQHLNTITDVLNVTPGITVLQRFGADQFAPSFFSRGFEIKNFQIDGGAPISYGGDTNYTSSLTPAFDMSKYDHVEVLRGAGGAFTGTGDPGGVLNLERKRPTDKRQLLGEIGAGSWNAFRASADLSVPLVESGDLKARAVLTYDRRDYFYRAADKTLGLGYLNLEYQPDAATRINIGGSYTDQQGVPFGSGLPRFKDGSDSNLQRSTCLCLSFGDYHTKEVEVFAQFEHHFGDDWSINANLTTNRQRSRLLAGRVFPFGGIDPITKTFAGNVFAARQSTRSVQNLADLFVTGRFMLFGREQHLVVGLNYQKQNDRAPSRTGDGQAYFATSTINPFTFDPDGYSLPGDDEFSPQGFTVIAQNRLQLAGYATLRLEPIKRVHVDLAVRYNRYDTDQRTRFDQGGGLFFDQNRIFKEGKLLPAVAALSLDVTDTMSVYGSYAGIYQSQATQLTSDGSTLPAVTGSNIEVGLKRIDFEGKLTTTLSYYQIIQNNLPVFDPDPNAPPLGDPAAGTSCCYIAADRNRSKGFDIEVTGALLPRLQVTFSYTHNTNKFDPSELSIMSGLFQNPLVTQAPKDLVKYYTAYRLASTGIAGRITLGGGGHIQSRSTTNGFICGEAGCVPVEIVQKGYELFDLFTRVTFTRNLTVQVNINNVLDKKYYSSIGSISSGNYYGEPRSFAVVLRGKF